MSVSSNFKYLHYVLLSLLAVASIQGGLYCGLLSFTLLGLVCTGLEFAFLSGPKRYRTTKVQGGPLPARLPILICGIALGVPGFLYLLADMANSEPGSPRYPVSLVICGLLAAGLTVWLLLAVLSILPKPVPGATAETTSAELTDVYDRSSSAGLLAAGVVLLCTLTGLSCALRASAVFEPTKLVVYGMFPWQDKTLPYNMLTNVEPVSFSYGTGRDFHSEAGFRLIFANGGNFEMGPTWNWRCPREKALVDNRIMALLQPHLAELSDRLMASEDNPKTIPTLSEPADPIDYGIDPNQPIPTQIATLEEYLKTHRGPFDTYGHNILRHLYMAIDERKAMEECDHIFANSFMDDYTLQCLSDWNLDKEPTKAVQHLRKISDKYADLKYLHAACTLEIARLYKQLHREPDASRYLALLIKDGDEEISAYRNAAASPDEAQSQ